MPASVSLPRIARTALERFSLVPAGLSLVADGYNTTFRVKDAVGARYILRVHRPTRPPLGVTTIELVESELWWLDRLHARGVSVPEPVRTARGEGAIRVEPTDGPEGRICSLLKWIDGRFLDRGLRPAHLRAVGRLTALLHDSTGRLEVPSWFVRGRVDGTEPANEEAMARLVHGVWSPDAVPSVRDMYRRVRDTAEPLGDGTFALLHADIHQENYLFTRGAAGNIALVDFDDCGWGRQPYDLAVTLQNIEHLPAYPALRAALLEGYTSIRPLPAAHEAAIDTFMAFRELQMVSWHLEERGSPGHERWEEYVRYGLGVVDRFLVSETF